MSNNDDIDNEDDVVCVDYTTVIVISSVVGAVALVAFILIFQFIRYDSISRVLYIFAARPLYTALAYCCIFVIIHQLVMYSVDTAKYIVTHYITHCFIMVVLIFSA